MTINNTLKRMSTAPDERTVQEKIAALRVELHEIYKRAQQGEETPADSRRVDDIAYQIHELSDGGA